MPDRISRFEILEKIGEGGMGVVYKARDPRSNRSVAIKLLKNGFHNPRTRAQFVQEARAGAGLPHPCIVSVFEFEERHDPPFIVMEFLAGDPLDHLIKRRTPVSFERKLALVAALCDGLGYAHRHHVVHRDIKPANLMVMPDGLLKILDFGIAEARASEPIRIEHRIGTYNYMAPEQIRGDGADERSDIFAVGAVFYEILGDQRAFPTIKGKSIAYALGQEPVPLGQLCPGLAPEIGAIVSRALEKNPDDRYQDVADMAMDIGRVRHRLDPQAVGSHSLSSSRRTYPPFTSVQMRGSSR